jgi:cyclic pyranopterin phosphate synthase
MPLDQLNRPLKDLRISVTDRCNFRCPYCMPAELYGERYKFLPKSEVMTFEEITRLAGIFVGLGVTKLRLTGGEPLVRTDLETLVGMLSAINGVEDIAMTTNGYLLAQHAQSLKDAGLHRVTVSLDTLDDEVFRKLNGRDFGVDSVLAGIQTAADVGFMPIKINSVVMKGVNDHTVADLARWCKESGYIARFIEYMDVGNLNDWQSDQVVSASEILKRIDAELPLEAAEPNYPGEVAKRWMYKDGSGEVGVIASVSSPFCGDCTRARLSTDGKLFTCLFGSEGKDLLGPMRDGANDEEMAGIIGGTWSLRTDRYSELRASLIKPQSDESQPKVEMFKIGG